MHHRPDITTPDGEIQDNAEPLDHSVPTIDTTRKLQGELQIKTQSSWSLSLEDKTDLKRAGWSWFGRCCRELHKNSPEVCREVHLEFADRISGAHWVSVGRMLRVHRRKSGARRGFIKRMLGVHREMIGQRRLCVESCS
ncbi:hypothetical protein GW17_00030371 [Ensete ventricosum]|nr:hypothetical protein GW17_00030371 [Ensete ventricosum]